MSYVHEELPVLDNPYFEIIKFIEPILDMETGPWLAGGMMRRYLCNTDISEEFDIDIFCANSNKMNSACDKLNSIICKNIDNFEITTYRHLSKSHNALSLNVCSGAFYEMVNRTRHKSNRRKVTIQFIDASRSLHDTENDMVPKIYDTKDINPTHILDRFDFTICQFLTDGKTLMSGKTSKQDLSNNMLVLHEMRYTRPSLNRVSKYMKAGYIAPPGTLSTVFRLNTPLEKKNIYCASGIILYGNY